MINPLKLVADNKYRLHFDWNRKVPYGYTSDIKGMVLTKKRFATSDVVHVDDVIRDIKSGDEFTITSRKEVRNGEEFVMFICGLK